MSDPSSTSPADRHLAPITPSPSDSRDRRIGLISGIGAYLTWGAMPLYFSFLAPAQPWEIIAHRVSWSLVVCLIAMLLTRQISQFWALWRQGRTTGLLTLAAVLIAANWIIYVAGVFSGNVLDAALGYFINPLITIGLAVLVLREHLRPAQWIALGTGAVAVVVIALGLGRIPWIALGLAISFALYGLVKKQVGRTVAALPGLAVETATLTPLALGYLIWLHANGSGTFGMTLSHSAILASSGLITAIPLILFSASTRRLPLSVVGMLQYLGPLLQFLIAVVVLHEAMPPARWIGFSLVWVAISLLSIDGMIVARRSRLAFQR